MVAESRRFHQVLCVQKALEARQNANLDYPYHRLKRLEVDQCHHAVLYEETVTSQRQFNDFGTSDGKASPDP
jgi:hypothetical protein